MPKFEKLRVSLARDAAPPLIEDVGHPEPHRTRREFLEAAFGTGRAFIHLRTGKRYEFIPLPIDGDYAAGIFKRERPVPLHDASLQAYDAENYEGATAVISLSKDQITWIQVNSRVGSTKSLLESFFDHLTTKTDVRDWKVYVEYLDNENDYWTVVREKRNQIAQITFTFIPPNALSADDEIYNLVKAVQQEASPDVQKHTYRASPGKMRPDTPHMNASARIAMAGGGDANVRAGDGKTLYSSSRSRVTREVPEGEMPTTNNAPFVRRLKDWLFGE